MEINLRWHQPDGKKDYWKVSFRDIPISIYKFKTCQSGGRIEGPVQNNSTVFILLHLLHHKLSLFSILQSSLLSSMGCQLWIWDWGWEKLLNAIFKVCCLLMKNNSSNLSTDNPSHKKVGNLRHSSSKTVQALTAHLNVAL